MFHHILVPLDGSSLAECVLGRSIAVAKAFGARVTFLRVLEEQTSTCLQPIDPLEWDMCRAEVRSYLDKLADQFRLAGVQAEYAVLEGSPAPRILEFVQAQNVDLVILSSHGRSGLSAWNVGSILTKIVLRSRISTMIIRAYLAAEKESAQFQRLMIPLDCSQRAECVLAPASTIARHYNSEIFLVHVLRAPEMPCRTPPTKDETELADRIVERNQREARKYFEGLQPRLPSKAQIRLYVADNVPLRLHELISQENFDLLILSAHGYSGTTKWPYGSVTSSFILYGTAPVLIIQDLLPTELEPSPAEISIRQSKGH